jgi:hypothetical protein
MNLKIVIVAIVFWLASGIGGALWGRINVYLRQLRTPVGVWEMEKVKDSYKAGRFQEALSESQHAAQDERCGEYRPQFLYVEWIVTRRLGRMDESKQIERLFLRKFPGDALGAEMYYASAMKCLANGNYHDAESALFVIENSYSNSRLSKTAKAINDRLLGTEMVLSSPR